LVNISDEVIRRTKMRQILGHPVGLRQCGIVL